ncbi:MAG TPA: two-component sensor histidine kinase [Lachnoclostridium phytofermentans]|uniref:histidine kinase n=1 Tax=Lachnoclostridium phytofermentans TaxID=66219 RepID=A0A3D2X803_9FIRM|nr:histidine kinase dimerization/phospho-acceptor domain-containing protein [Lachnoclostridium sp.]HCL03034.1 two-component sensor histidine kinase [Lachnoclostridium phytofermentans]
MDSINNQEREDQVTQANGKSPLLGSVIGILLAIVLLLGVSITAVDVAKQLWENRKEQMEDIRFDDLLESGYGLYLSVMEQRNNTYSIDPIDIYLPKLKQIREEYRKKQEEIDKNQALNDKESSNNKESLNNKNGSNNVDLNENPDSNSKVDLIDQTQSDSNIENHIDDYPDDGFDYNMEENMNNQISEYEFHGDEINSFNENIYSLRNHLYYSHSLDFAIIDRNNNSYGEISGNEDFLTYLLESSSVDSEMEEKLKDTYVGYLVVEYDSNGSASIQKSYGIDVEKVSSILKNGRLENNSSYLYRDKTYLDLKPEDISFVEPTNVAMVYAINKNYQGFLDHSYNFFVDYNESQMHGLIILISVAIGVVVLLGIILFCIRPLGIGNGFLSKIPLEIDALFIIGIVFATIGIAYISSYYPSGAIEEYLENVNFSPFYARLFTNIAMYGGWFLYLGSIYLVLISVLQLFRKGLKRYLIENVLFIRFFAYINRRIGRLVKSILSVNLSDGVNKTVLKYVIINFLVILIMCSIWFFGIPVLVLYSIVLYYFVKKYLTDLKDKHDYLLYVTHQMAEGNLEVPIEKDLGVLKPLGDELSKIQHGFKRAVDEEVKSQNMRTELITNVSHDLKTPLTAIITYVNLLKEDNLTKEQQKEYIDTLDRKSLRLKQLIEDLFEVSKINSNNITLNPVEVDLVELIKQVQLELSDRFEEAGIEVRTQFPEEKVILMLDSQRTYRIFENLFVNVIKYALPGTRAYLTVQLQDASAQITLKNISATELNLTPEEISERFIRGDKSRNTDGSGLGLAIVKSFVEIQGGLFQIVMDGDLFKVIIRFTR